MGTFGERLQREREMRGITLEEIAEATKIGTRSLRALEREEFDKLPGGIFNKGFVRAYARYLGIDEEQAVADYLTAVREAEAAAEPRVPQPAEVALAEEKREPAGGRRLVAVVLLLAAIVAGAWYLYNRRNARQTDASVPAVPAATQPAAAPTLPAQPTSNPELKAAALPKTPPESGAFVLRIHAREDSWMHIIADGKVVMSEILKASGEKEVRAQKQIVLTAGNAGGVEISHNGKTIASLGPENKPRTVTFTPAGLQQE